MRTWNSIADTAHTLLLCMMLVAWVFSALLAPHRSHTRRIFEKNGSKVAVDELSSSFLQSCTIDFEKSALPRAVSRLTDPEVLSARPLRSPTTPRPRPLAVAAPRSRPRFEAAR